MSQRLPVPQKYSSTKCFEIIPRKKARVTVSAKFLKCKCFVDKTPEKDMPLSRPAIWQTSLIPTTQKSPPHRGLAAFWRVVRSGSKGFLSQRTGNAIVDPKADKKRTKSSATAN